MHRIFVAEDNPGDVFMLEMVLRESGAAFQLEVASTGKQALQFLENQEQADSPPIALILLDLNLPQHDGLEILRRVREQPALNCVPIVLFTSSEAPADRVKAFEGGAHRFVRKPSALSDFRALGTMLREILENGAPSPTPS